MKIRCGKASSTAFQVFFVGAGFSTYFLVRPSPFISQAIAATLFRSKALRAESGYRCSQLILDCICLHCGDLFFCFRRKEYGGVVGNLMIVARWVLIVSVLSHFCERRKGVQQ